MLKVKTPSVWKSFFHASFWLIWLSITLGFAVNPFVKDRIFFAPGGQHGEAASDWMISYVGYPGTLMILIATFLVYCIVSSNATIPFLKRLFFKKSKNPDQTAYDEDTDGAEPTVAVGTEIVPENWVVKGNNTQEEEFSIQPENETAAEEVSDVHFEIEKPEKSDENKAVDAVETTSVNEEMMIRSTILPNWVNMTRHWI